MSFLLKKIRRIIEKNSFKKLLTEVHTPLDEAIFEIQRRRADESLQRKVRNYLNGDIPAHFNQKTPVCYLSRHIATANEETLHFISRCQTHTPELPIIIGQDPMDTFVPGNTLKHNLGKLPIFTGRTREDKPIYQKITIVDFNEANGKKLSEVRTICSKKLLDFHNNLLELTAPEGYCLVDESEWISRHYRGNLIEHYKHILALLLIHGIMFEFYEEDEDEYFVKNVLIPAFRSVEKEFGVKPLITHLVEPTHTNDKDWNAYPSNLYATIKECLESNEGVK